MRYQNINTGYVLDTDCEIKGQDWVELKPASKTVEGTEKPTKKKAAKKDE